MLADISNVDAIYIVCGRTDMRKSIDGLCAIIQDQFSMENRLIVFDPVNLFALAAFSCHDVPPFPLLPRFQSEKNRKAAILLILLPGR